MNQVTLLGVGTVGSAVARACLAAGSRWTLRRALVRDLDKARGLDLPAGVLTTDANEALGGEGAVIEVLGNLEPAASLIAGALEQGRPVVTANKQVIGTHGPHLFAIARRGGARLGIEACVGAGVPVIAAIRQLAGGQRLTAVSGVVNGTTNAILGAMEAGQSYDAALRAAQEAGFAEPDPTADVEGYDAAAKLAILAALAFGLYVAPAAIPRRPLADVAAADLRWAAAYGGRVKYVARAALAPDGTLASSVGPTAVPLHDALAAPTGPGNAIRVEGPLIGATTLAGPGAGAAPTAGALLGDLALAGAGALALIYPEPDAPPATVAEPAARYAVRLPPAASPAALGHDARWTRDGADQVGLVESATGSDLAAAVRAAGGTLVRWDLAPW